MRRTTEKEAEQNLYKELLWSIYTISDSALMHKSDVKKVMEEFKNAEES